MVIVSEHFLVLHNEPLFNWINTPLAMHDDIIRSKHANRMTDRRSPVTVLFARDAFVRPDWPEWPTCILYPELMKWYLACCKPPNMDGIYFKHKGVCDNRHFQLCGLTSYNTICSTWPILFYCVLLCRTIHRVYMCWNWNQKILVSLNLMWQSLSRAQS